MYTGLKNVILKTTSNIPMYLKTKHTYLHYYIWLQIHKYITLSI